MHQSGEFQINPEEEFPRLSRALIREAVIEIRARASVPWNEAELLRKLKLQLPEYPKHRSGFASQFHISAGKEPKVATKDLGWQGLEFTSADKKHIAKFHVELFSFSRLYPYENWAQFTNEAMRLWKIHRELAKPSDIQRLGVRFINRIPISGERVRIDDYFRGFPDDLPELNLTLAGFLHHDILAVPGHRYSMNIIKTVQPPEAQGKESALILDIDVYTGQPFQEGTEIVQERLAEKKCAG